MQLANAFCRFLEMAVPLDPKTFVLRAVNSGLILCMLCGD
jgi:hypothetical protein